VNVTKDNRAIYITLHTGPEYDALCEALAQFVENSQDAIDSAKDPNPKWQMRLDAAQRVLEGLNGLVSG